ncbi:unnamed protein product [Cyprideis torosa]|uniref:Uncharacterized protein n=1 Tax=Cyprideis torosa TaxID=163714 RepID=A0A7R8ZM03_9CRUS|nr:unnamed protein product [Cyprideis torosa]CAG0893071.1 unnamed protein product [Cyprideis torosa]
MSPYRRKIERNLQHLHQPIQGAMNDFELRGFVVVYQAHVGMLFLATFLPPLVCVGLFYCIVQFFTWLVSKIGKSQSQKIGRELSRHVEAPPPPPPPPPSTASVLHKYGTSHGVSKPGEHVTHPNGTSLSTRERSDYNYTHHLGLAEKHYNSHQQIMLRHGDGFRGKSFPSPRSPANIALFCMLLLLYKFASKNPPHLFRQPRSANARHSLHAETPGEIIREILAPRRQGNGRISTTRSSQTASVSVETEHEASPTDDHPPSYEDVTKQYPSHEKVGLVSSLLEKPPRPPYPDDEDILPPPFSQAVAVSPLSSDVTPTHTTSSL